MSRVVVVGAGNIGRGFLAELCAEQGTHVTFCDVNEEILKTLKDRGEYEIEYVGADTRKKITNYAVVNSAKDPAGYEEAVARADAVMTAIGVNMLPRISKQMAEAINKAVKPRLMFACENAVRASSLWRKEMLAHLSPKAAAATTFVDVAVDRIVPAVRNPNGDVAVEPYRELICEQAPNGAAMPFAPTKVVANLDAYIARKLYLVNGVHTLLAWRGIQKGLAYVHESLADPEIAKEARELADEMTEVLVDKHRLDRAETHEYAQGALVRFANARLRDTNERVGRGVIRKISPNDRLVGPLAHALEKKMAHSQMLTTVRLAVEVRVPNDDESARLLAEAQANGKQETLARHTGLPKGLFG